MKINVILFFLTKNLQIVNNTFSQQILSSIFRVSLLVLTLYEFVNKIIIIAS